MWHLPQLTTRPAFVILALDSVVFTGLFQLPGHMHPAQMPPPLGSLPWLNLLLLQMTLTFPYSPSGHCWKLGLTPLFLPWGTVGCLGPVLQQMFPTHIWLGGKLRLREETRLAQGPTAVGDGLGGHRHSCSIFHTKSASGTF